MERLPLGKKKFICYVSGVKNGNETKFSTQLGLNFRNMFKVFLAGGHVTCHVTFGRKEPLFVELPTVFNIKQIVFLDGSQIFPAFYVWNDRTSFRREKL